MKKSLGKKSQVPADENAKTFSDRDTETPKEGSARPEGGSPEAQTGLAAPNAPVVTSFTILGAHVTWFVVGPFLLLVILMSIVRAGTGWLTALDATFFAVVAVMILGRWVDQRSGQGTTMTGEPSTWEDFRRYAILLPPLATVTWILANVLGNHWFQGGAGF